MDDQNIARRAVTLAGGPTKVARICGISVPAVSRWMSRGRVPAAYVLEIERMCDARVTRYQLAPDVFGETG
jgi:DNA-binding transcriptional regulator YdaS (Cro superfamily)